MKPILMNTEMVKAILAGRKTVTRRIAFPNDDLQEFDCTKYPNGWWFRGRAYKSWQDVQYDILPLCKYKVGDVLYVPEPWKCFAIWDVMGYEVEFQDGEYVSFEFTDPKRAQTWAKYLDKPVHHWQSPYFMPKEAARIFLRVTDVRVERLRNMTEADAAAEGVTAVVCYPNCQNWCDDCMERGYYKTHMDMFAKVWNSTIKKSDLDKYGWNANPWVWVIEFERISKEEANK